MEEHKQSAAEEPPPPASEVSSAMSMSADNKDAHALPVATQSTMYV